MAHLEQHQLIVGKRPNIHTEPLRVPIIEAYPEELQQVHPVKKRYPVNFQQVHPEKEQTSKIKIGTIRQSTPAENPHMVSEEGKLTYTGTIVDSFNTHKYNTQ